MLLCITADYTAEALKAMASNPSNRQEALSNLCEAAGAKVVAMYGILANGPGAMAIIDAEPLVAPAICGVIAATGRVQNVHATRLFTMDEVSQIRQKRSEITAAYKAPGQ
jgi:uncharacterized protein with GYD domain